LPPNVQKKCRDILSFQEIWPENRRIIGHNLLYAEDLPFPCLLRAYPNNRVVMRLSEKAEAKAAGQKCPEAWLMPRRGHFSPTTQASDFAAGRNRAG